MGRFSSRPRCIASVFATNVVIRGNLALVLRQAPRTSLSLTPRDCIISQSTTVNAATNLCQVGRSYCVRVGFQRHFHIRKRRSPSTALICSMNSCYKGIPICMTTTTHSSDDPIMPTYPLQLCVKLPVLISTIVPIS
jgi:hypothetical protein